MDTLFQHASDRAGFSYLSRISPEIFWVCVWLTVGFCAIHMIRRARNRAAAKPVAGYNLNQRLYHWGNFLLLALLVVSGYWLFFRRSPAGPFGLTWLQIHSWSGMLFTVGVVFHAVAASFRGDWRSMRPQMRDFRDARTIWRNFMGRTSEYPIPGKYDALQKIYHHILAFLAISFTVSGVWMWLSAERFHLAERSRLHLLRVVHDSSAVLLLVMIVGHVYFSLIKANRANLKDMAGLDTSAPEAGAD